MNARKRVIVGSSILALFAFVGVAAASGKKKTTGDKKPCRLGYHRNEQGQCVSDDDDRKCGDDMMWRADLKKCVPQTCPAGYRRQARTGNCVKKSDPSVIFCPDGQQYNTTTKQCEPTADDRCPPGQVRNSARLRLLGDDLSPSELADALERYPLCVPAECPEGTVRNEFGECALIEAPKKPINKKCPAGSHWVAAPFGEGGSCIPDDPTKPINENCPDGSHWVPAPFGPGGSCIPDEDIKIIIKDYPEGNAFYQVKYGDIMGWGLEGKHNEAISQRFLRRELFLSAREFGGLDDVGAQAFVDANYKNRALTNVIHDVFLCCGMNDLAYGTWGYCGAAAKNAGRCDNEQQRPSKHGRAIRLLTQHADNAERLKAGIRMARTVSILKPGDKGNGKSNPVAPANPGGDNSYPLLWLPGIDRKVLWTSNGTKIEWISSQANPPGWITDEGVDDYSGSLEKKYGCKLSNYNGEVELG